MKCFTIKLSTFEEKYKNCDEKKTKRLKIKNRKINLEDYLEDY